MNGLGLANPILHAGDRGVGQRHSHSPFLQAFRSPLILSSDLEKLQQKVNFPGSCLTYRDTMSATSDEIKGLLALRDSLNSSIDAFIDLSNEERAQVPKVNQARQKISSAARKLATEVANPQQEATALAFAVSTFKTAMFNSPLLNPMPPALAERSDSYCP